MPIRITFHDDGGINGDNGSMVLPNEPAAIVTQVLVDAGYEVQLRGVNSK